MAYESYYTNKIIKTTKAQYDALKNGESVKGYKLNEKDTFVLDIDSLYNDLANKTETDNGINKSLYNLGYYDTITENSDGTYTITRQTGYLDNKKLLSLNHNGYNGHSVYQMYFVLTDSVDFSNDSSFLGTNSIGSIDKYTPSKLFSLNLTGFAEFKANNGDNEIIIAIENCTSFEQVEAYLRTNPIFIQYKLATATTEKVEKNNHARYNQKFILEHNKNEAERSIIEGKVIHEKYLDNKLGGYVNTSNRQEINGLKIFKDGVALNRDDTGIFKTDDGANVAIKSFGKDLYFYGKSGVENYVANAIFSFAYSGENNSYVYTFPQKNGTIALTNDFKTINGNSILGGGDLSIIADSVYTKVTEGVNYYDLEWGKTYKIKMNNDNYAYCSAIPNIKFYGTFEITNFSIRYSDQGTGVGIVGPEYDYIISVSGNRYLASQGQDVKRGASATTHSKPPIRLSAYGGSTFSVYLLN